MTQLKLEIKRLSPDAKLPTKAHADDSGFDIYAAEDVVIEPGETVVVKTGIAVKLPPGHDATVRPRSGVTSRTKLRVQIGTIDNGYHGEIGVIVDNIAPIREGLLPTNLVKVLSGEFPVTTKDVTLPNTYLIRKGDRIGQLCISEIPKVKIAEVEHIEETTERGANGFGSSGTN